MRYPLVHRRQRIELALGGLDELSLGACSPPPALCVPEAESPLLPLPPPHPLPRRSINPVTRIPPSTSTGAYSGRTNVTPLSRLSIGIFAPGESWRHPPHPRFGTRHLRSSLRWLNSRIAPVRWRDSHRSWTGAALYLGERRDGEVRRTSLPCMPVNKSKKKGRSCYTPALQRLVLPPIGVRNLRP